MFTCRVEVLVSRPLDEVFAVVGDVRNRPRWDESVDSEDLTSPEPIGQYTWEIVEQGPPNAMRVESTSGPFPTTRVFQFFRRDGATDRAGASDGRRTRWVRTLANSRAGVTEPLKPHSVKSTSPA